MTRSGVELADLAAGAVRRRPDAHPIGQTARPVPVPVATLRDLVRAAMDEPTAHWVAGRHSLLVHLDRTEVTTAPGVVVVVLVTETIGGFQPISVPFAIGRTDRAAGLLGLTSARPDGPDGVVEHWAEALVAVAWQALIRAAAAVAAATGRDTAGRPLTPMAIRATGTGLTVTPGARSERKT